VKFTEAQAHLAVALRDPLSEYTELLRALREGSDHLEAAERKLAQMAAADGHPIDWGKGGFRGLLRGKPGPGGGFEATPTVLSFFLTGYLLDVTRRECAARALTMTFATVREQAVCPKTKERFFGPAFAAVLADPELFAQCADIGVSADLGLSYIDFVAPGEDAGPCALPQSRSLFYTPDHAFAPSGRYVMRHLYPFSFRSLMSLIQSSSKAAGRPARAGTARAAHKRAMSRV
jgi:hypothetical protein